MEKQQSKKREKRMRLEGAISTVPRHTEVKKIIVYKICKDLSVILPEEN
jgi:hypothetical protein